MNFYLNSFSSEREGERRADRGERGPARRMDPSGGCSPVFLVLCFFFASDGHRQACCIRCWSSSSWPRGAPSVDRQREKHLLFLCRRDPNKHFLDGVGSAMC